jgi:ParB family chromosome partitioning protein
MMAGAKGLGRGLDVLIPQDFDSSILLEDQDRVQKLFTKDIEPALDQPRKHFDQEALEQLTSSVKQYGILQPIVVSPSNNGKYTIVAGERRWRAAQMADLSQVPVVIRSSQEQERLEIAIVENVQRVDLSPLEQAASIQRLHDQFNLSYQDIAARLGKAVTTVNNIVRLLQLPTDAQKALHEEKISEGHARSILALKDLPDRQTELLHLILSKGWSVRQAEQFVQTSKQGAPDAKTAQTKMSTQTPATKQLSKFVSAPVSIRHTAKGGKLEIGFKDESDLQRIIEQISN